MFRASGLRLIRLGCIEAIHGVHDAKSVYVQIRH